ncbi:MAG: SCO family protein, partial [Planctomycetota bacterium]
MPIFSLYQLSFMRKSFFAGIKMFQKWEKIYKDIKSAIDLTLYYFLVIFICPYLSGFGQVKKNSVKKVISVKGRIDLEQNLEKKISLDTEFVDENGKKVALKDIIHKPTILTLVYFTCPGICTPLLNELQKRLEELTLVPGKDFQVVSISFDARDTFQKKKKKRDSYL